MLRNGMFPEKHLREHLQRKSWLGKAVAVGGGYELRNS